MVPRYPCVLNWSPKPGPGSLGTGRNLFHSVLMVGLMPMFRGSRAVPAAPPQVVPKAANVQSCVGVLPATALFPIVTVTGKGLRL